MAFQLFYACRCGYHSAFLQDAQRHANASGHTLDVSGTMSPEENAGVLRKLQKSSDAKKLLNREHFAPSPIPSPLSLPIDDEFYCPECGGHLFDKDVRGATQCPQCLSDLTVEASRTVGQKTVEIVQRSKIYTRQEREAIEKAKELEIMRQARHRGLA